MLLEVKDLTVYYDSVLALDSVSFNVGDGEFVVMIGPNGAGKSTSLKAVSGLIGARSGEILLRGEDIKGMAPFRLVKKGLCLVPEGRRVFTSMTVFENLEMGAYLRKDGNFNEDLDKIFSLFPVLKDRRRQKAGTLSTGEQQMLAIGRALMLSPKILLLDEPSLGLSPNFVETVFEKIKEINRGGVTILMVEQNARTALEYADRGYVFEIGRIAFDGPAEALLKDDGVKKTFLGEV